MRDAEPSSLLDVEDLGVWLGRRQVLDVTRLRIDRGVIIMLSGDNGSGKTTLLKCLAGLLPARRARFRCLGMDMAYFEAKAVLATLLPKFRFALAAGADVKMNQRTLTPPMLHGLQVVVTPR